MKTRIQQVRIDLGWSEVKMAEKMGVSQATISNWEYGRAKIPMERLLRMSEITGFPVSYILGEDILHIDWTKPLDARALHVMHRNPVWTRTYGWGLVNLATQSIVFADGKGIGFDALGEDIFGIPPALSLSVYGFGTPLAIREVSESGRVWLEPIGIDNELNAELRGWYHPHGSLFVANEIGIRFYLDTYGAKWLAFSEAQ